MGSQSLHMLAVDFGASSGRAVTGAFNGRTLTVNEVHRFSNEPVRLGDHFHWDFLRLFHELKQGIHASRRMAGGAPVSVAVDTWGVDYGLVDAKGRLAGNPYHYRDLRTEQVMPEVFSAIPEKELFRMTGIRSSSINTIYQLYAEEKVRSGYGADGLKMLMMPDLFHYYLSGVMANEYTIASTSGLLDPRSRTWHSGILNTLSIPESLFSEIVMPGTMLGQLRQDIREELQVPDMAVIAAAGHDTAAAVASVPAGAAPYAFISSGTWSLMGIELDQPALSDYSRDSLFSNEGGAGGKIRLLKNIMGLWLLQECRRTWALEGTPLTYDELTELALSAPENGSYIDAADAVFLPPGGMPQRIREYCRDSGQKVPESRAAIVRCIVESLALQYRQTLDEIEKLAGERMEHIHIVGGGIQNRLLCQLTANVTGRPVIAGPVEATAIGNLMMQALAHGEVKDLAEIRQVVLESFPPETYLPEDAAMWEERYQQYVKLFKRQETV
ncbi:carbohydrate kinase [Paenibacillus sp. SSG-1]|uniref:Carbohydrate kinase n=2 Tax=Paenibacillus TaxID=44249 RepID=A0ABQ4LAT5_9BACL|nr:MULTISPECIES: rhamnulokinase family protein [Paenibacillus]MCM2997590.1 FGGY-family carbohydrate kinase [Paenibacillus cellulositrophicus]OXL82979.1 carbohydrate kinase [Paenibacillus sp. SSG-1]GIO53385.1 carbohydrate kinase [Paenibacillus cineris]